jgi:hypothetical protein
MEREHGVFKVCVAWAPAGGGAFGWKRPLAYR